VNPIFGTTQGRLVPSRTGELQCFPQEDWDVELHLARRAGLHYVEWLIEREHNPRNPIWSGAERARILETMTDAGLIPYSAIDDYLLDHPLGGSDDALQQTLRVIDCASALGLRMLVLPLLEASEPWNVTDRRFIERVRQVADAAREKAILVCLETVLAAPLLLELIHAVGPGAVWACFDTGNRAHAGHDIAKDIQTLGAAVRHVHVKDKNREGENVYLGTGLVDLFGVCQALAASDYRGAFTFEAVRGRDPVATARMHRQMLEFFLNEAGVTLTSAQAGVQEA
jgi:sugar phosphate isomerase/epimerase